MADDARKVQISVVGAADASAEVYAAALEVGREVALRGGVVVCGGLGGVMEAACKGAAMEGGKSVAVLPGSETSQANRWATVVVATGMVHARNVLVVQSGAAVVALAGEAGTMSEIALALKIGRPVVSVGAWGGIEGVTVLPDAAESVAHAFSLIGESGAGSR